MKRTLLALLATAACTAHVPPAPQTAAGSASTRSPAAPVPLETYFETRRLYGISFSPDEKWVAFASDINGRPDVYIESIEGGEAKQITHVKGQLWTFDFSPAEDRLVYQTDMVGDENTRLYLTDHLGSPSVEITAGDPSDRRAEYVDWSRDGKTLLYLSNRRDLKDMDLYEYDVASGKSKLIWQASGKIAFATVSHDHRHIAVLETLSDVNTNLYLVEGEKLRSLTPHEGNVLYGPADFTADDRALLYTSDEGGEFQGLRSVDLASTRSSTVLASEWDVEAAGFSPSFKYQFTQVNADGAPLLALKDSAGKPVTLPQPPPGGAWSLLGIYRYANQPRFSRSERYFGVNLYGTASPGTPYVIDLEKGTAHPVAEVLPPALRAHPMVAAESVRVASFDGRKVPAFVYRPTNAAPGAPAIIFVHGGPTAQSLQRFDPFVQYLLSKGYVLMVPNVRGSTGYGKTYTTLDNHDWGGGPLKDVVACKSWLVQNAGVAADKVVTLGGSYGGYMALAAATFTPTEFAANVDYFGVSDLKTLLENIPPYWSSGIAFLYIKFGNPNDPADAPYLHDRSPIWFADRIQRPLLVVQGDKDVRVKKEQSDRVVEALKKNSVPVHYLLLLNEGHGFSRNESRLAAYAATDRFLDRYLFGDASVKVVPGEQ